MMINGIESDRLILKPMTFNELIYINNNELSKIEILIEEEALLDEVKRAVAKKIIKMQNVSEEYHEWFTYWLIINKSNNNGIGFIGFKGVPDEKGLTEVGYSISPKYRGEGLMTEALTLLINWASRFPECMGITATNVLKTNIGSNKVLNKCKFVLENSSGECNIYKILFNK